MARSATAVMLTLGLLSLPGLALPRPARAASSFDGNWAVTIDCPQAPGTRGFNETFLGRVTDGVMHAQRGSAGVGGSIILDGRIMPDGSAALVERGWVGNSNFAAGHLAGDTGYTARVPSRFDASHGTGTRTAGRACSFSFAKS